MRRLTCLWRASTLTLLFAVAARAAEDVDPSTLYSISTEGTSTHVKPGDKGRFVLAIKTKNGSHVSDEAPLKLELSGKYVVLAKTKLVHADSVAPKVAGKEFADPRFEVPFTAAVDGKGSVDAKLTFFVCTEQLCSRQQRTLSVAVQVN